MLVIPPETTMTELSPYCGSLREKCLGSLQMLESLFYRHISSVGAPKFPQELTSKIRLLLLTNEAKEWSLQSFVWDMSSIYYSQGECRCAAMLCNRDRLGVAVMVLTPDKQWSAIVHLRSARRMSCSLGFHEKTWR